MFGPTWPCQRRSGYKEHQLISTSVVSVINVASDRLQPAREKQTPSFNRRSSFCCVSAITQREAAAWLYMSSAAWCLHCSSVYMYDTVISACVWGNDPPHQQGAVVFIHQLSNLSTSNLNKLPRCRRRGEDGGENKEKMLKMAEIMDTRATGWRSVTFLFLFLFPCTDWLSRTANQGLS